MTLLVGLLAIPLTLGKTTVGTHWHHMKFEVLPCSCHISLHMKVHVYLHCLFLLAKLHQAEDNVLRIWS